MKRKGDGVALSSPSYQLSPRQLEILEQLERFPRVDVNDLAGILNGFRSHH